MYDVLLSILTQVCVASAPVVVTGIMTLVIWNISLNRLLNLLGCNKNVDIKITFMNKAQSRNAGKPNNFKSFESNKTKRPKTGSPKSAKVTYT